MIMYFVNTIAETPMIDIINRPLNSPTGFVSHWHTHKHTWCGRSCKPGNGGEKLSLYSYLKKMLMKFLMTDHLFTGTCSQYSFWIWCSDNKYLKQDLQYLYGTLWNWWVSVTIFSPTFLARECRCVFLGMPLPDTPNINIMIGRVGDKDRKVSQPDLLFLSVSEDHK